MSFKCEICGEVHDEWPALTFDSPLNYSQLNEEEKNTTAELTSDFCIIKCENQTDRFIRCTLTQKVNGHSAGLDYGIWISLSQKSFDDYRENFDNENHETGYFGYLCNDIPGYPSTLNIYTNVYTQKGDRRPIVIPQKTFAHPFVTDYYNGISKIEAEKRIHGM
jgi:hypothetical protein